ncbi:MAG: hypothetical protein ACYCQJ_09845 [Nitrososphaerales archaeon]
MSIKGRSLKEGGTFAIVRVNNFDQEKLSQGRKKFEEFESIHSSMRGIEAASLWMQVMDGW